MLRGLWVGVVGLAAVGCVKAPGPVAAVDPAPAETVGVNPTARQAAVDLHQPFEQACTLVAPDESLPPPGVTRTGKPTAPLQLAVRRAWDGVRFAETDGKADPVRVTLDTTGGPVEVTLFPDAAPNHVRNVLALARVGFYDGLVFERVVKQEVVSTSGEPNTLAFVTLGCPAGDGRPGIGHLGYFLKPEPNDLIHEEGTVGYWREASDASAGTRLTITLARCPLLDGKFTAIGKVTRGMAVVHAVAAGKLKEPDGEQPEVPTAIQRVEVLK